MIELDFFSLWPQLPVDGRGIASRDKYVPFQVAGRGHQGSTGYNSPYLPCARRSINLQASTERALLFSLVLNPTLLDFREHYPAYDRQKFQERQAKGMRSRKSDMPTLDGVATFGASNMTLYYVGYTVKESGQLDRDDVWRRVERERSFCQNEGWGWRLFTEKQIDPVKVFNAQLILSWANTLVPFDDDVRSFALAMSEQEQGMQLRELLKRAARNCNFDNCHASALFAHALLRGWLSVDTSRYIGLLEPLYPSRQMETAE